MNRLKMLFLLLLLTVGALHAQTPYVEVMVTDSITLPVVSIDYYIKAGAEKQKGMFGYTTETDEDKEETVVVNLDSIILDLEKQGYQCMMVGPVPELSIEGDSFISINLKSVSEYFELDQKVKHIPGVHGKLLRVDHEPEEKYKEELFKQLYQRALNEAGIMAKVAGAKTGKMLSATETQGMWSEYGDVMKQFMNKVPFMKEEKELTKYYIRKFTFRFELK